MEIKKTKLEGVLIFTPRIFNDERGHFFESFNLKEFQELSQTNYTFVQDNQSLSKENVIRGMHFQLPPFEQGKLVRVISGSITDVVIDLRKDSETYGKHIKVNLDEVKKESLWIPPGFAHGFKSNQEGTIISYKCTNYYNQKSECSLAYNDPDFNIDWEINNPMLSEKDTLTQPFCDFVSPF